MHWISTLLLRTLLCLLPGLPWVASAQEARAPEPPAATTAWAGDFAGRDDARQLARQIADEHGLDPDWVLRIIERARYQPDTVRLMRPRRSGSHANWRRYRSNFIDETRIRSGVHFWQRNRQALERAQREYGVPPEIIVGIIGVETIFGQHMGDHATLDALVTLALDFPAEHPRAARRTAYFQGELGWFLALCQRQGWNPGEPRGSYAGAMGIPQFMPSSIQRWAVDFDGDGQTDLRYSEVDAIGSVASYFVAHGWQPGMPTHYSVYLKPDADLATLLAPDIEPSFTPQRFQELGALALGGGSRHAGKLALVRLDNGDPSQPGNEPRYVAGTQNFYAVTRYNQSSYYALAVIELGRAIAAAQAND